jgi:hypothetical protein
VLFAVGLVKEVARLDWFGISDITQLKKDVSTTAAGSEDTAVDITQGERVFSN